MVKGRKSYNTKAPSPCKQNRILCSLNHCQDIIVHGYTKLKLCLLLFEELNMGNDDLSINSEYDNCFNINVPFQHALNQVDSITNLVDEVILIEVVLQPTKNQGV